MEWMRRSLAAALVMGAGGCAFPWAEKPATGPAAIACQTVRVFDQRIEPPDASIPAAWRAFSGHWAMGAWDGKLCHEIVVERIWPDGRAQVLDLHGEYLPWNVHPSGYRRQARITADGTLLITIGRTKTFRYRVIDGVVRGVWTTTPGSRAHDVTLFRI